MKTIWKYPLQLKSRQTIEMRKGARIVSVANQGGQVCVWAMVDSDRDDMDTVEVFIVGTGHPVLDEAKNFIGTILMDDTGMFVWHVFTR